MSMRETTQRQRRIAEQVRQLVAEAFYQHDFSDVLAGEQLTVSSTEVSRDMKLAKVFYTLLSGDEATPQQIKAFTKSLNEQAHVFNHYLATNMHTKYTPKIRFFYDQSFEEASRVDSLLSRLAKNADND
ncbi:MAG: ribosome-binding factor A [Magnetococcales bacterium]|nr:ribosome-binding factor A [Magnetococcales bacterium]|tara:strand:+ start:444727 stop:445113 length:387 start_codon:yes stop_codon:yes gene_type:complete